MKKVSSSLKKFAVVIVLLLMVVSVVFGASAITSNTAFAAENPDEEKQEVFSYKEVFDEYYTAVCSDLNKVLDDYKLDLNDFINGYYYNGFCYDEDITIADYTAMIYEFVKENGKYVYEDKLISTYSASSKDANYFLASLTDYAITPASEFERQPNYSGYKGQSFKLKDCVKNGDIIHESAALAGIGHTGVVVDCNHQSIYGTYIQTIEAVNPYVKYAFLDDTRMVDFGVIVLRVVDITDNVSQKVKYFCERQLGKKYSLRTFETNTSIDSTEWYCSEMVYSAFRYAGLDIIDRESENVKLGILPNGILYSKYTYEKCVVGKDYLDIDLVSNPFNGWAIKIYNNTGAELDIIYNKKMCFKSDAENWSNLKDEDIIYSVKDRANTTVTITVNWFASSVAISYKRSNIRFISYADNLIKDDKKGYTLRRYYSVKYI